MELGEEALRKANNNNNGCSALLNKIDGDDDYMGNFLKNRDFTWSRHILIFTDLKKELLIEFCGLIDLTYEKFRSLRNLEVLQTENWANSEKRLKDKLDSLELNWSYFKSENENHKCKSDCEITRTKVHILECLIKSIIASESSERLFQYFWKKFRYCPKIAATLKMSTNIDAYLFEYVETCKDEEVICDILQILEIITNDNVHNDQLYLETYLANIVNIIDNKSRSIKALIKIYNIIGFMITMSPKSEDSTHREKSSEIFHKILHIIKEFLEEGENGWKEDSAAEIIDCDYLTSILYCIKSLFIHDSKLQNFFGNHIDIYSKFVLNSFQQMALINKLYSVSIIKSLLGDDVTIFEKADHEILEIIEISFKYVNDCHTAKDLEEEGDQISLQEIFISKILHIVGILLSSVHASFLIPKISNHIRNCDFNQTGSKISSIRKILLKKIEKLEKS
ncbi:MAG: hypothetical protein MHMPM18_002181 [Marteilia pararefringens]